MLTYFNNTSIETLYNLRVSFRRRVITYTQSNFNCTKRRENPYFMLKGHPVRVVLMILNDVIGAHIGLMFCNVINTDRLSELSKTLSSDNISAVSGIPVQYKWKLKGQIGGK